MTGALAQEILQRSGEHLLLVALSVGLALLIALPLGLAIQGRPRLCRPVMGLASAVQTIPSLAIFGLLLTVPLLGGIGPAPAVVALTLYALLPLLRGLLSGLEQVGPGLHEAGRSLGLSPAQVLRHIQLPLAIPSLMAGLRVATVISVGVATIAAAIGAGGLGVFIFRGIATLNNSLLLAGALPAAAIALIADGALAALERQLRPGGLRPWASLGQWDPSAWGWVGSGRRRLVALLLLAAVVVAIALGSARQLAQRGGGTVVIGSKGFTEQLLLGELLAQEIEARTALKVRREFSLGSTYLCHQALRQGRIDGYVEYTGSAWSAVLKQPDADRPSGGQALWRRTRELYDERYGLRMFPSLGFENTFAILVRRDEARLLGLKRITEAVAPARQWRAGFGYEFLNRPDGYPGLLRRYDLRFSEDPVAMDLGLTYRALAEGRVDLIAGDSTNGLIPALRLQMLEDDRHLFPPYDAVPVFNGASLRRHPELVPVLESLSGRLTASTMQRLNAAVDLNKQSPEQVIRTWRERQGARP